MKTPRTISHCSLHRNIHIAKVKNCAANNPDVADEVKSGKSTLEAGRILTVLETKWKFRLMPIRR